MTNDFGCDKINYHSSNWQMSFDIPIPIVIAGLSPSCETLLLSEMTVTRAPLRILNSDVEFSDTLHSNSTNGNSYKYFVPRNVDVCTVKLTVTKRCDGCDDVIFLVQPHSLPTSKNYLHSSVINSSQTGDAVIEFYPHENSWHYVDLKFFEASANDAFQKSTSLNASSLTASKAAPIKNFTVQHTIEYSVAIEFRYNNANEQNGESNGKIDGNDKGHSSDYVKYVPLIPKSRNFEEYPLLRQTYREFFMYDYDLVPDVNGTVPVSINLTAGVPALMKFDIGDVYDIGGTLSFAIAMKYDIAGGLIDSIPTTSTAIDLNNEGAIAEKLVAEDTKRSNQTVIVCMRLNEPGIPTWPDKCVYGRQSFAANSVINNTDAESGTGLIHIPFPETGTWYLTIGLFCHGDNFETGVDRTARTTIIDSVKTFIRHNAQTLKSFQAPCSCAVDLNLHFYRDCLLDEKCLNQMNETETLKIKECLMDIKCTAAEHIKLSRAFDIHHKLATEQSVNGKTFLGCADGSCNTSVVFTLASNPCVTGRCGRNGRCYHYMSGGFVFSTCLCLKFYRGWDCTEDSQVPSSVSILAASLLLTLSNLLFIPSIYFAVRREYYTEAVIYFFAMFFSTFYHACDSGEEEFSFCLVKISVLQFCDFYCGLLAIWVIFSKHFAGSAGKIKVNISSLPTFIGDVDCNGECADDICFPSAHVRSDSTRLRNWIEQAVFMGVFGASPNRNLHYFC